MNGGSKKALSKDYGSIGSPRTDYRILEINYLAARLGRVEG
jgi:hypothetical protein